MLKETPTHCCPLLLLLWNDLKGQVGIHHFDGAQIICLWSTARAFLFPTLAPSRLPEALRDAKEHEEKCRTKWIRVPFSPEFCERIFYGLKLKD